jgi:predicted O-linked N-acetylglucosamine transferase (SPINDLY family)
LQGACHLFQAAISMAPRLAAAHKALGDACVDLGRPADADRHYRAALAHEPDLAAAWNNLGLLLRESGRPVEAREAFGRAMQADPALVAPCLNLAALLVAGSDTAGARALLEAAARRQPGDHRIAANLAALLLEMGDPAGAEPVLRAALQAAPGDPLTLHNLALALRAQGLAREATALLDRAIEQRPADHGLASARLLTLQYRDDLDAATLAREHFAFGDRFDAAPELPMPPREGRLRVGFVSADFGFHVVAAFLEPLLDHLDRDTMQAYCYHAGGHDDAQTARLRGLAVAWRDVAALDDEACAARIRADRLHLCIDLSGHTGGNRLPVFARRVAPVQATWLGYPDGTGLAAMDARFTDAAADPPGRSDTHHRERLVRLPGFLGLPARREAPPVAPLPAGGGEPFTFGSFNNLAKASGAALALWASVLAAVPGSRLRLKARGLEHPLTAGRLRERFAAAGGDPGRLVLEGATRDSASHLARYGAVDVALDSFPYHGTTTTCEALLMGVPVVTLAGDRHAARAGASLLARAGHPEWVAGDADGFVGIAARLASDLQALAEVRARLRAEVAASPLADAAGFARDFERACRALVESC